MKEISEYTAEVFRRSEERIKERRKKHRRILAICIPFCLIAAVCSAVFLPEMLTEKMSSESVGNADNSAGSDDIDYGAVYDGFAQGFVSVDIKGTGENAQYQSSITDAADANNVFEQICEFLPYDAEENPDGTVTEGIPKEQPTGYIITLTADDGTMRIFTLNGNRLYDAKMRVEVTLTDEQMSDLKSSLGLTD